MSFTTLRPERDANLEVVNGYFCGSINFKFKASSTAFIELGIAHINMSSILIPSLQEGASYGNITFMFSSIMFKFI